MTSRGFAFELKTRYGRGSLARTGTIKTPHGEISTPAFIVVGTRAAVRALTPEMVAGLGGQAVLGNAYHLYLRPGSAIIDRAGGLGAFMNWPGPTFTDSGGFQVLSMGSGFKKVLAMTTDGLAPADVVAKEKLRLAHVDDDGVTFTSHIDGSKHRFTPESSLAIQHELGADIMFAFDELTSLMHSRGYQEDSLRNRTHPWAVRSLEEHKRQTAARAGKPYQALFAVLQGAQYEDLRRETARYLGAMDFDGFGLGGALEKDRMGDIVRWMCEELPEDKPRHLLGISDPRDIFAAIESGVDTFDCVAPTREARNGAIYRETGRFNITRAQFRDDYSPLTDSCGCYTCTNYSRAYIHHLFRAGEMMAATLASIHNEHFIVQLVDEIRASIDEGRFEAHRDTWLARFYAGAK